MIKFLKSMKRFKCKEKLFYIVIFNVFLIVIYGCATTKGSSNISKVQPEPTLLTNINIDKDSVSISATKPFIYTIYQNDPYRITVDMPNVLLGTLTQKIVSQKGGITEVIPSQINSPTVLSRVEIVFESPSNIDHDFINNSLIIKIKQAEFNKSFVKPAVFEKEEIKVSELKDESLKKEEPLIERKASPPTNPLKKANEITEFKVEKALKGASVVIKGDGSLTPNVFPLGNRLVIDIYDVILAAKIPPYIISPLKDIRTAKHEDRVRIVLDLKEGTTYDVSSIGDSIIVALATEGAEPSEVLAEKKAVEKEAEVEIGKPSTILREREVLNHRCEDYLAGKEKVNFDFQDQDIVPILRLFADISGCNIFIHPDVKGRATMKFKDVPWDQALDTLLKTFSLGRSVEGNIIRIAPHTVFTKESEEKAKALEAMSRAEPLEAKVFLISYADVDKAKEAIVNSKLLSARGSINVDKRTSTLFVKDIPAVFPEIEKFLSTFDRPTPQVLIEARIVEVSSNSMKDLGIQWGIKLNAQNTLSSFGGSPILGTGAFTGNNFIVDLPSGQAGEGSGSGITFGFLNPARTVGLDLQLSALQTLGKSKIISSPKIVTLDNVTARIMQGEEIPYPVVTGEGNVSASFKPVAISIEVTPHITPTNSIMMNILTTKEDFKEFVQIGQGYAPRTTKVEGKTNVLVQDGETIVIGGVYKKKESESERGVPGIMKIPLIGWLFKSKNVSEDTSELLIFITPKIVQKAEETVGVEKAQ